MVSRQTETSDEDDFLWARHDMCASGLIAIASVCAVLHPSAGVGFVRFCTVDDDAAATTGVRLSNHARARTSRSLS